MSYTHGPTLGTHTRARARAHMRACVRARAQHALVRACVRVDREGPQGMLVQELILGLLNVNFRSLVLLL